MEVSQDQHADRVQKPRWTLPSVLQQAHLLLQERVTEGGFAVDATVGNGNDTLFLAEIVGDRGHVHGFDIQKMALEATGNRLTEAGLDSRASLHHVGHERMADKLPLALKGRVQAFTFNLGYLPNGDKTVITKADSTLQALETAFTWLAPGGVITVVMYNGHPGGGDEQSAVLDWAAQLPLKEAQTLWYQFLNQRNNPPTLLAISRNR